MKKQLFVLGLAVAALASCTNEEVTDIADSNVIGFKAPFVGNATKAGLSEDNQWGASKLPAQFFVYGNTDASTKVFENVRVYNSNSQWVYDELKQWASNTYKFAAYSVTDATGLPADKGTVAFDYDNHKLTITDYISNDNYQQDLLLATSDEDLNPTNVPVPFTFKHALAMVKFTFQSSLGDENPITISNFKVSGMHTKGTVAIANTDKTPTWSAQAAETSAVDFTDDTWEEVKTTAPVASDEFVVIPQNSTTVTVTFTSAVDGLTDKNLKATITANWEAGKRYNYVATITGTDMDVIEFADPIVENWGAYNDPGTDTDLTPAQ